MITKKKTKTSKSNKEPSIVGSIYPKPPPPPPHKIYRGSIFLRFIGANETISEIPVIFADKSYPLTPTPPGNINPVQVVSTPVASSHPMKLVAVNVLSVKKKNTDLLMMMIWLLNLLKRNLSALFLNSYIPHTHSAVSLPQTT